jgi:alginate O-acetyltransferase complex protein AlgI
MWYNQISFCEENIKNMVFSSNIFLFGFLPIVLLFYFVILKKSRFLQNIFLFIVSIIFYAWGEPVFVIALLLSIVWNWFCALKIAKNKDKSSIKKLWLVLGVIFDLSILFVFKYLNFFANNISGLFSLKNPVPQIALPIGISFFTFQAISYIVDVYREKKDLQKNPLFVGLYIAFFPQLIAGPIVRYETVADQIQNRKESLELFSSGITRFIIGLGKKVVLSNTLAIVADSAFNLENPTFDMAWLGAIAYTLQIFFDFSGYSDMAIGLGRMFGFKFKENFNKPYLATSISDFWRRWHISMGTWFRDYVYFPLGGSRVKKSRILFNLFIVWLLTGLWHGANWTFIIWGLFYFIFIAIEKFTGAEKMHIPKVIGHIYTLFLVIIGWVFFRADNISYALNYLKNMFSFGTNSFGTTLIYLRENAVILLIAILACLPVADWFNKSIKKDSMKYPLKLAFLLVVFLISVIYIVKGTYNPFIYFNF